MSNVTSDFYSIEACRYKHFPKREIDPFSSIAPGLSFVPMLATALELFVSAQPGALGLAQGEGGDL
jgi:hypothetical protein